MRYARFPAFRPARTDRGSRDIMRFTHTFIDRPILASVVSIFITLIGLGALFALPVEQYPDIVPPTVQISTSYPGASAEVVDQSVATPLQQQINGVENMLYMSSQSTGDGKLSLTVTFRLGTDLNMAQVLTQNRVTQALPRLPDQVQRLGVTVQKVTPSILLVVHLVSPDESRDQLYLSNYATLHVKDVLARLPGVGNVQLFGGRDYAMRIWLDPDKAAAHDVTAEEIVSALRAQNIQVSAGVLNQQPTPSAEAYELNVQTLGRLHTAEEFADIIVKNDRQGHIVRIRDIGRAEVGAQDYSSAAYLDLGEAIPLAIYAQPGANSLAVDEEVKEAMKILSKDFPPGVAYTIQYDPTEFISKSVHEVEDTILIAILLVVGVVILFLQTWRASLVPVIAIPVSLIGTFTVLALFGITLNNLSLFGLVLAVGIVVDDAIVVVENVERNLRAGMSPSEAAHRTMDEVGGALIAIALTLCAVFVPSAFLSGITGAFFRQFAVTIAASTVISAIVSLTLSPALCAVLFRPHDHHTPRGTILSRLVARGFALFNRGFDWLSDRYGRLTRVLLRGVGLVMLGYAGLIALTGFQFSRAPTGFIPDQDKSYLVTLIQLPPGASLDRTKQAVREVTKIIMETPGVSHAVPFAGLDIASSTNASNAATVFSTLRDFDEREKKNLSAPVILKDMQRRLSVVKDAFVLTVAPPPVEGIGEAGGFKLMVQDRTGVSAKELEQATQQLVAAARKDPALAGIFMLFNTGTPSVYADMDRQKAEKVGMTPGDVFGAMQLYLGSTYINDFNYLGRTYQVVAQADGQFRRTSDDIGRLKARNASGHMVPIGTVARFADTTSPYRMPRYNLYPSAEIMGGAAPGVSSGTALAHMERLAEQVLPHGFGVEWTELAYQQQMKGTPTLLVFGAAALFVFLVLAAQYESWKLPLAVVLIVPMCLLAAVTGLLWRGMAIDILAQIGFVVLVGLAAKNAILIVEFARQAEDEGATPAAAAEHAARTRLRPILMTSLAFILGVLPLVVATGAGAEMRQSLGTTVFAGMLGVTGFGLLLTPSFYTLIARIGRQRGRLS
ncbi:Acriflavin resistance plasma membrane protein [Granulibacter bethesdensis]|nr:Acriflavin resistance plasma membrane protein [Granulibacter bethesdensis]